MSLAHELAERCLAFGPDDVDEATIAAAKTAIIDTLAVTLLGSTEPCARLVSETPGIGDSPGPALVLGTASRVSCLDAALINGVSSHALDFDDFTQELGGHPSVPVLPALLGLAEDRRASGRELIAAYAAGVELETRLAYGVHFVHYEKGWHPTATLGVFGSAGACANLLGLAPPAGATALSLAASMSSGIKANFGTMTKPLHVGHCGRNGLLAALLAARGFTASPNALDAPQGFLEVFNGPGAYDVERMLGRWFDPPVVVRPGISLKQFPCCGSIHPAISMAVEIHRAHAPALDAISTVGVRAHPQRLPHTDNPNPASPLGAKFSMQYCVARALLAGRVGLADFEEDCHLDPTTRELMSRVRVAAEPSMAGPPERTFGAEVEVILTDGRRLTAAVDQQVGRGPGNPMTESELYEKFSDCASRILGAEDIEPLWGALWDLDGCGSVRELTALMAPDRPRRQLRA